MPLYKRKDQKEPPTLWLVNIDLEQNGIKRVVEVPLGHSGTYKSKLNPNGEWVDATADKEGIVIPPTFRRASAEEIKAAKAEAKENTKAVLAKQAAAQEERSKRAIEKLGLQGAKPAVSGGKG